MDQAWMSLQHPYTHQHHQQHQQQYLEQQQLPHVGSAARVIPYIPKRRAADRQRYIGNIHLGQEQHAVQHLPTQVDTFQILLPAVYLPPLHLQPLLPDVAMEPTLLSSPTGCLCPPTVPAPSPIYSSLPEARFNPWLFSPILCPQMVPLHQTRYAEEVDVSTTANVTTASQWTEAHAWPGGQGSMTCVKEDQKNKAHKDNTDNEGNAGNEDKTPKDNIPADLTEDCDRPGPPASLDEEAENKDSFEECFRLLESFFDQLLPDEAEEPREEECEESGYLSMENSSFLEYLDELCRDEDFVSKVESTLNIEVLMSPLSASQELFEEQQQEMILQEALPPTPANSDHLHRETPPVPSQLLFLDPPGSHFGSNPNQKGQNSSQKEVGISCSPLLPSCLLEDLPVNFSHFEKTQELNKPRRGETKRKKKEPGMKGGETKTLEQEVRARKENQIKVKPYPFVNLGQRVDKERKKLQEKQGAQLFKRKQSQETKLTSTAEQPLETTKKKRLQSPNLKAGKHSEPTFILRCEHDAIPSGSLPTRRPESTNIFESIFWDTWPQVQKSSASSHEPSLGASPDLTVSPAKKHRQACQATRKRGRSADRTGTEMEQLGPSPPKKAAKSKRRKELKN